MSLTKFYFKHDLLEMEPRLVYSEGQETFIREFSEVLRYNEHEQLPSYNPGFAQLEHAIVIREPRNVRRSGRTTAFCELIGRLFTQSCESPVEYALAYTRIDKHTLLQKCMLLREVVMEPDDVFRLLRKWLLDVVVSEAIGKHHFYYMVLGYTEECQVRLILKKHFPDCDEAFFKVEPCLTGLPMDIDHDNVVIYSANYNRLPTGAPLKYIGSHLFTK